MRALVDRELDFMQSLASAERERARYRIEAPDGVHILNLPLPSNAEEVRDAFYVVGSFLAAKMARSFVTVSLRRPNRLVGIAVSPQGAVAGSRWLQSAGPQITPTDWYPRDDPEMQPVLGRLRSLLPSRVATLTASQVRLLTVVFPDEAIPGLIAEVRS